MLTPAQLRAIGEMQQSCTFAAREIKRVARLAREHGMTVAGLQLDPLRESYADLSRQVMDHMNERAKPENRRAA